MPNTEHISTIVKRVIKQMEDNHHENLQNQS
jgi:hypothetical protein